MIDTGANVYCVPNEVADGLRPMCRNLHEGAACNGVHGKANNMRAMDIPTPFGFRNTIVTSGCDQSLMPGSEFMCNGYLHSGSGCSTVACYRGVRVSLCTISGKFVYAPFLFQDGSVVLLNDSEWHK